MKLLRWVFVAAMLLVAHGAAAGALRDFDAKSLSAIRTAHAGKPFVLVFWSIHCAPCLGEMAQWGPLHQRYPGVDIVLVATDRPSMHDKANFILKQYDLKGVQTWAFADEFEERVRYSVDPDWRGELPRMYLYDSAHHAQAHSGPAEREWIEPWLAQQVARRK